jgi:AraC-like DNA-binding protein
MARILRMIELATGVRPQPRRVSFRHAAPPDLSEHERIFATRLSFGVPRNELAVERAVLELQLVRADPRLSQVLDQHVRDLVARAPAQQSLADRVRRYLRDAFPGGDFALESIGRRMGTSARTLQRQLSAEGTSYRQILEQARQELALRYLAETQTPIKEVAALLGYAELQAFYRAFERWTGLPPAAYRRQSS